MGVLCCLCASCWFYRRPKKPKVALIDPTSNVNMNRNGDMALNNNFTPSQNPNSINGGSGYDFEPVHLNRGAIPPPTSHAPFPQDDMARTNIS